jgi:cell division protease FtsH
MKSGKSFGDSHAEAKKLLREHRKQLDALVEALLKHETLDEQEVLDVTGLPAAPQLRDGILPLSTSNGRGRRSRSIGNGSKA